MLTIILLNLSCNYILSQAKIKYCLSNEIEDSLSRNVNLKNKKIACLWRDNGENIDLIFFETKGLSELRKLSKLSNRVLCLSKSDIPIVFYSDIIFSKTFNKYYKSTGTIKSESDIIIGGYYIKYKGRFKDGIIIEAYFDR